MIKALLVFGLAATAALPLKNCSGPKADPVTISDSCAVIKKILYSDGKLQFSPAEIDALSEENQIKLVAVKKYYRENCLTKK